VAYSPFGHDDFPQSGSRGGQVLAEIAAAHGATPHQVVLAFLARHPAVFAIPKAARLAHVEANAAATSVVLDSAELARLDAAFPRGAKPRALPMI